MKRIQHFLGKQDECQCAIVCYWLLRLHIIIQQEIISTAINRVDYITFKKLIETVKSYCFLVIDSDIEGLKYKHNNKIFKELFYIFSQ